MADLPPLPPGASLLDDQEAAAVPRVDPAAILKREGFEWTNGYRTDEDIRRLRREGYKPAMDSRHKDGDAVDLTHPRLSPAQQDARLKELFGGWRGSQVLDEGTHRHLFLPGWGQAPGTPGTPYSGIPDLPKGATLVRRGALTGKEAPQAPSGQVHDGDTLRLSDGRNGRVFGADAYELNQQGRRPDNSLVPLGTEARDFMASRVSPDTPVHPTGAQTYGRPVVTLGNASDDPARDMLRLGYGLAAPDFLKGSPQFGPYMEAERLARLNRLGGHGTNAETPSQFRHKNGPWAGATPGVYGQGADAVFADERTPFQGLRPEIAKGYLAVWSDPKSKPEDLVAYAQANGFAIDPGQTAKAYARRNDPKHYEASNRISYLEAPRPMIDPGDGTFGSLARGFGDPVNVIDELGGVADSLGLTQGRENVFNSDRRFGDVLWNNIDQNRDILAHDNAEHPGARLTGQIVSGLATPAFGLEGVASRATAKALEEGASRFAATEIGKRALVRRFAAIGGGEGTVAGFGAGEGNPLQRLPNAVVGGLAGTAGGAGLGLLNEHALSPLAQRALAAWRRWRGGEGPPVAGEVMQQVGDELAPFINEGAGGSRGGGSAAMAADRGAEIVGPVARQPDRINVNDLPPLPEGATLVDNPFGVTRDINKRLSADEMAKLAEGVDPASVLPRPGNEVGSLEESIKAIPSRFEDVQAPDERHALDVRTVTTATGGKVRIRGPLDLTQSLRLMGGVKDAGGDLASMGINNEARRMDFGSNEQFLGKLINNETGHSLDDATHALWERGYFPEFRDRPTTDDLLDKLRSESTGAHRYFHPNHYEEVADFYAAQAQRGLVENAEQEGSPLAEERGHTINLDDLMANTPPANAYEDMPRLTGKMGNINLDRLEKPQDVTQLLEQIGGRVGGFDAAARGKITHEETQRLAVEMGVKPEQLLKRQQGQALNAEQLYASRALVQRSRETVARLAKKAVGGSDEDVATFRKAWLKHVAIEEQITGATAEAGRALSQFRMLARAQDAGGEAVRSYLKGMGGKESIEDAANAIVDLMEDPAKASHFMREGIKPRWRDKFNELWVNSLLSGPRTHVVNFVGNALTTALSFPEQAMTAGIGKLTRSADRATFGEVGARAAGLADSSIEALRRMRTAFKTGEPIDSATKVEAANHQAIGGLAGRIIRTPTRALTAADEFWKTLLGSAELRQLSYRKALSEASGPEDFKARYEALLHNPPEPLVKQSQAAARYYTFQKELGPVGRGIQQVSNNSIVGKILIPFVRTPSNIIKFAGERSVFGLAMPEVRQALRAGGRARDEALAKITLGSGLSTAAIVAALDGRISGGGPTDSHERAALLQSGWQPYSIRIGDEWYSYQRFDPVSTLIGVAADFAEAGSWASSKEADSVALNLAMGIAKNITNKTWLSGLSDAFDVLSDPERYGKAYVQRLAAAMAVPALVSQTAQATDPNLRDARSIMDAIKARVPVLSNSVPVRRNVWGDPVSKGDALGPDIVSPFYASKVDKSPLNQEIARLRAPLSMPQRFVHVDGRRVDLSATQYDELVQMGGHAAKQYLEQAIQSPDYRSMSDEERVAFVKDTFKDFHDSARIELLDRHPELGSGSAAKQLPALPPGARIIHQ